MDFGAVLLNVFPLALLLVIAALSIVRHDSRAALQLCACSLFAFVWALGSFVEPLVPTFESKLVWRNVTQVGAFYLPAAVVSFCLAYIGLADRGRRLAVSALYAVQTLPLALIFTDASHHLMRSSVWLLSTRTGLMVVGVKQTILGEVFVSLNYFYSFTGVLILLVYALRQSRASKWPAVTAALFIAFPSLFSVLKNTMGDASFEGVPASCAFALGSLVILYGLRRSGLLGLGSIARDQAFEVISEGILVWDVDWRCLDMNPSARRMLAGRLELPDDADLGSIGGRMSERIEPSLDALCGGEELRLELPLRDTEHPEYFALRVFPLMERAKIVGYTGVFRDVTKDTLKMSDLRSRAEHDPLTGAYNKTAFRDIVSEMLERPGASGCLIIFDIDHFKDCNDHYGHLTGDAVLKGVSTSCRKSLRDRDVFGRVGGDEFAFFLVEAKESAALALCERVRTRISACRFEAAGESLRVTVSMGAAHSARQGESFEELFARADAALYRSKAEGRNRVTS